MLAAFHGRKADLGTDRGNARRVNHHIDQARFQQRFDSLSCGDAALLDGCVQRVCGVGRNGAVRVTVGDCYRTPGCLRVQFTDGANFDAAHVGDAADNVSAHLAGPNKTDSHGLASFSARGQVLGQARQGDIRGHCGSPVSRYRKICVHLVFCQS